MTEVQEKLIELLDEIDGYCKKGHLSYFLGGEASLSAYRSGGFESDTAIADVFMTLPDALKLQKMILKDNRQDRLLESPYNNDYFPNLSFRYCNKNTLYVNLNSNAGIKSLGICVKIKILRKFSEGKLNDRASFLEHGWDYNYIDYPNKDKLNEEQQEVKHRAGRLLKISRKLYKRIMLKFIERTQKDVSLEDQLYYESITNKQHVFGKKLFSRKRKVELEGHRYPIPKNADRYFRVLHTLRWREKTFHTKEMYESRIIDPRLPYEVYLSNLKEGDVFSAGYQKEKEAEITANNAVKESNSYLDRAWNYVLRTGARFKMWEKYMPQKAHIQELYAKEEWDALKDVFKEYDTVVQQYYELGLGVCFDKEIFDIYLEVLRHFKEARFANKLQGMIPECHFKPIRIEN